MIRVRMSGEATNIRLEDGEIRMNIHDGCGNVIPCVSPLCITPVSIREACRVRVEGTLRTRQVCSLGKMFTEVVIEADDFRNNSAQV